MLPGALLRLNSVMWEQLKMAFRKMSTEGGFSGLPNELNLLECYSSFAKFMGVVEYVTQFSSILEGPIIALQHSRFRFC